MCECISLKAEIREVSDYFHLDRIMDSLPGPGLLRPTDEIPVILGGRGNRRLERYVWGIFPLWAKDSVNARSEAVRDHIAYRKIFARQRCIVPCSSLIYKLPIGRKKEKTIRISLNSRPLFGLAALYDVWITPGGQPYRTCTILTSPSAEPLAAYHPRTPVILEEDTMELWMQARRADEDRLAGLLKPYSGSRFRIEA